MPCRILSGSISLIGFKMLAGSWCCCLVSLFGHALVVEGNPMSHPYVPFHTSPYDGHPLHHSLELQQDSTRSRVTQYDFNRVTEEDKAKCPLQFTLGVSHRTHTTARDPQSMGIIQSPIIYPIIPSKGPGKQVVYATQYEHLDMLTPASKAHVLAEAGATAKTTATSAANLIKEGLVQTEQFPLLFESSYFAAPPILHDINDDGIVDAILSDYDGGIYVVGLQLNKEGRRHFHRAQVPRLFVRRQWVESRLNETLPGKGETETKADDGGQEDAPSDQFSDDGSTPQDPYHSYFEYSYGVNEHENKESILRGVTANALGQDHAEVKALEERRNRNSLVDNTKNSEGAQSDGEQSHDVDSAGSGGASGTQTNEHINHRRLSQEDMHNTGGEEEAEVDVVHRRRLQEDVQSGHVDPAQRDAGSEEERRGEAQQIENAILEQGDETKGQGESPGEDVSKQFEEVPSSGIDGVRQQPQEAEQVHGETESQSDRLEEGRSGEDSNMADSQGSDEAGQFVGGEDDDDSPEFEDKHNMYDDAYSAYRGDYRGGYGDDVLGQTDDDRPRYDDDYPHHSYDDYYGRYNTEYESYYDNKHYTRLPPHILAAPVLAELPKMYSNEGESEMLLFLPVTYYFDEDEHEGLFSYKRFKVEDNGDESEVKRGMYVSNALMIYHFGDSPRWGRQEHLDMSTDHTAPINSTLVGPFPLLEDDSRMGAFALATPTIADIDGDGSIEVLIGTSMGLLYAFDARHLNRKEGWPVQLKFGIENRILVEDVRGDTNLEVFVADVRGNIVCLDHNGGKLWHRDLLASITVGSSGYVFGSSPMVLGDVDGDGILDVVVTFQIKFGDKPVAHYVFAVRADSGMDVPNFPIRIWGATSDARAPQNGEYIVHQKLPTPLLVDLHADQQFLNDYLRRNGTKWTKPARFPSDTPPHGGSSVGLHIVQPMDTRLHIIEAGSGCIQTITIGEEIVSMVQADDVHGTNNLDLVVSTTAGNIVTLESQSPFHPLNTWSQGDNRSPMNSATHGFSAPQGIFVHDVSRQYRDIFGVYVPVTFEIFDNRPNIQNEPDKRVYFVEIRDGSASSRVLFRKIFNAAGIYTERLYIPYGPGYYALSVLLKSTHGLVYVDTFHLGYNVHYMDGFGMLLWMPLAIATVCIVFCGTSKSHWDDEEYEADDRNGRQGILGAPLPP